MGQFAHKGSHSNQGLQSRKSRLRTRLFKHFKPFPQKGFPPLVGGANHLPVWSVRTRFRWVMRGAFRPGRSQRARGGAHSATQLPLRKTEVLPLRPHRPWLFSRPPNSRRLGGASADGICRLSLSPAYPWCLWLTAGSHRKPLPRAGSVGWDPCQPRERSVALEGSNRALESSKDPAFPRAAAVRRAETLASTKCPLWWTGLVYLVGWKAHAMAMAENENTSHAIR